jgi:hypothetical protein
MGFSIVVTDRDGWRKEYPLARSIIHVGSAPNNEIVLEPAHGGGVAARHVQIIATAQGARLVNIGSSAITIGSAGQNTAQPLAVVDIPTGEVVRIGDYTLTIQTNGAAVRAATSGPAGSAAASSGFGVIGLRASFPATQLWPDKPLDGTVLVRNLGDKSGAQFKLEIEGLEPAYFEIGPGPVLFPGAEKPVMLRLSHPKRPSPPAGDLRLQIRATAPTAYPDAAATLTQIIQVMPYYHYRLSFEETAP